MIDIPADDPKHPSKVFVIEVGQAPRAKKDQQPWRAAVLVYAVDATRPTGKHPVVIYPKDDRKKGATFAPGDSFEREDVPFKLKVAKKTPYGAYELELTIP